jgi:uncharacterized protein (DUF924 family)
MENADSVLRFWFGTASDDLAVAEQCGDMWWKKNPEVDREIRDRFSGVLDAVTSGRHQDWLGDARGRLAMIIVIDQFSRNIYRNTPQAFANDALALTWCKDGLESGMERQLRAIERVFFYLPLEHSESLDDQMRSVELFSELAQSVPEKQRKLFGGYLDYAKRHLDIVRRFGRFPHRNAILGRESTEAEVAFLQQPGSSF